MHIAQLMVRHGAWLLLAAAAAPAAQAMQATPLPARAAAADPQAAVPATVYRPAIGYRTEAPANVTPDQAWRDNNAIVAGYNSMALTMKGMAGHGTADKAAGADGAAADPHAAHAMPPGGHAGHHGHEMPMPPSAATAAPAGAPPAPGAAAPAHRHQHQHKESP